MPEPLSKETQRFEPADGDCATLPSTDVISADVSSQKTDSFPESYEALLESLKDPKFAAENSFLLISPVQEFADAALTTLLATADQALLTEAAYAINAILFKQDDASSLAHLISICRNMTASEARLRVLPGLTARLGDQRSEIKFLLVETLNSYNTIAEPALPVLSRELIMSKERDPVLHATINDALLNIRPEVDELVKSPEFLASLNKITDAKTRSNVVKLLPQESVKESDFETLVMHAACAEVAPTIETLNFLSTYAHKLAPAQCEEVFVLCLYLIGNPSFEKEAQKQISSQALELAYRVVFELPNPEQFSSCALRFVSLASEYFNTAATRTNSVEVALHLDGPRCCVENLPTLLGCLDERMKKNNGDVLLSRILMNLGLSVTSLKETETGHLLEVLTHYEWSGRPAVLPALYFVFQSARSCPSQVFDFFAQELFANRDDDAHKEARKAFQNVNVEFSEVEIKDRKRILALTDRDAPVTEKVPVPSNAC